MLDIGEDIRNTPEPLWRIEKVWKVVMNIIKEGGIIEAMVTHFSCTTGCVKLNGIILCMSSTIAMERASQGGGGLINMGLTCYGNAIMQNMRHISKLAWILEEGKYNTLFRQDGKPEDKRQKLQLVTQAFAKVTQFLWKCKKGQSVKPGEFWTNLIPAVMDTQYEQLAQKTFHDAHEFCQFLIETIHTSTILIQAALTEWKKFFAKEYSPLVHLFYGLFHFKTTCQGCANVSHRWEPFNSLKAPVKDGEASVDILQSLRNDLLHEELIDEYQCDTCGPPRKQAKRTVSIWKLPLALVISTKRFTNASRKISVPAAPVSLIPIDFAPFFSEESPEREGMVHYALRGIVDHHGSMNAGHYTAQCRHVETDQWFIYDDEHVHSIEKPVFGASTYMLFLERA
jgi:ubiquitin C-terminal hydrolase